MIKIETGLFDHMVWQRNRLGVSDGLITGTMDGNGQIETRITKNKRVLKGWSWIPIGRGKGGQFRVRIPGMPVGGPYQVELRVKGSTEQLTVRDLLVGDVWILAGQSNMEGKGLIENALPPNNGVRAFYMNDRWDVARDPLHNLWDSVDEVHEIICCGRPAENIRCSVGPGVAFGQKMFEMSGGVPQGLLCCAHGGTSMQQWNPSLAAEGTRSLYGATLRRLKKNGARVAGLIWYQGESDANEKDAPAYRERMQRLVAAFRRDTRNASLPVAMAQIGRVVDRTEAESLDWNRIQESQRLLAGKISRLTVVPTIDLELDDSIHIAGRDQARLGVRLAQAMHALRGGRNALPPPIALRHTRLIRNESTGASLIEVKFDHVVGSLTAAGRPEGFSLVNHEGRNLVYRIRLDGNTVILHCGIPAGAVAGVLLHYGRTSNPVCNILDEAGRSLPVFGPVPFGEWRLETPQVRNLEISALQAEVASWKKLTYPKNPLSFKFAPRTFPDFFCNLHPEFVKQAPERVLAYFRCRVRCAEPMPLAIWLGYDGPLKVWFDGREIFSDRDGINPAMPNDAEIRVQAAAGEHEVMVALDSNRGQAWGIFLRFERVDGRRKANQDPSGLVPPEIIFSSTEARNAA